jgi:hypothetical protein
MKFDHAWTWAGKPRGETPAPPPGKRTAVLPRLPVCRALLRQTGNRIFRAMLAVFRARRRQPVALGEHSSPGLPQLATQPRRHNRRLSIRRHRTKHASKYGSGSAYRTVRAGLLAAHWPPHRNRLVSACWEASKICSDFSNLFRPLALFPGRPAATIRGTASYRQRRWRRLRRRMLPDRR